MHTKTETTTTYFLTESDLREALNLWFKEKHGMKEDVIFESDEEISVKASIEELNGNEYFINGSRGHYLMVKAVSESETGFKDHE